MSARRLVPALLAALALACGSAPQVTPPSLALSATTLTFSGTVGGAAPAAQQVTVTNAGGGTLSAPTATAGASWLKATVSGAAAPYTITVQPNPAGLAAGDYATTVQVATVSAANNPQVISVALHVTAGMQVQRLVRSWADDGTTSSAAPGDITAVAMLQDDGAGGVTSVDLTPGSTAGTWVGAPLAGPWWARATWVDGHVSYYRGSGLTLDLGVDEGGRPGRTLAAGPTLATLDLSGLDPWDGGDGLSLDALVFHSWGAQASAIVDDFTPNFPLFAGDDLLPASYGFKIDWAGVGPLVAAADTVRAVQLREYFKAAGPGGFYYQRAIGSKAITGVAMQSGVPLILGPIALALTTEPPATSLPLDWRRASFETAIPPYLSSSTKSGHKLFVGAAPGPAAGPAPLGAVGLPLLQVTDASGAAIDFNAGLVPYQRIQPTGWGEVLHVSFTRGVVRLAQGAATGLVGAVDAVERYDSTGAMPAPVQPLVSAVTAPTIDGQDALSAAALVGISSAPTLAWTAPVTGVPTRHRVEVFRLEKSGTATAATPIAELVLDGAASSVTLPAGLLLSSSSYAVRLTAATSSTDTAAPAPYRRGLPYGEASLWTQVFTVQ